jgi:hypothetical protein
MWELRLMTDGGCWSATDFLMEAEATARAEPRRRTTTSIARAIGYAEAKYPEITGRRTHAVSPSCCLVTEVS